MSLRKKALFLLLIALFSLAPTAGVFAHEGVPAGSCPLPFTLHHFMSHPGEPMHRHIGIVQDLNGDGFICVFHVTSDLHVHVDNSLP